jgi:CDGSH-type Zn-finger protein
LKGPLFLRGNFRVVDASGDVVRRATRMALCRCGQSGNKPYCDLSHRRVEFRS